MKTLEQRRTENTHNLEVSLILGPVTPGLERAVMAAHRHNPPAHRLLLQALRSVKAASKALASKGGAS